MANATLIKRRIRSVKSTRQITKAMELVAASKMRRAQEAAVKSREYRRLGLQILARVRQLTSLDKFPLYAVRPVKKRLLVAVSSDRGLAGAYNANIMKQISATLLDDEAKGIQTSLIIIGKQAANFVAKLEGVDVRQVYTNFPENPSEADVRAVLDTLITGFTPTKVAPVADAPVGARPKTEPAEFDQVDVLYTDYKSSLVQEVTLETLLPAAQQDVEVPKGLQEATFEPSLKAVVRSVTERMLEVQLRQAMLESQASEQSARMMAMKNASDNAADITDALTLEYNSARQAAITQELAEITGGAEAIG